MSATSKLVGFSATDERDDNEAAPRGDLGRRRYLMRFVVIALSLAGIICVAAGFRIAKARSAAGQEDAVPALSLRPLVASPPPAQAEAPAVAPAEIAASAPVAAATAAPVATAPATAAASPAAVPVAAVGAVAATPSKPAATATPAPSPARARPAATPARPHPAPAPASGIVHAAPF